MNVLFITHYGKLYGANKSMLNLIDGLKQHNVNSFVITPVNGDLINELKIRKIPYAIIPFQWDVYNKLSKNLDFPHKIYYNLLNFKSRLTRAHRGKISLKRINGLLKEWNINIIHSNSFTIGIGMRAAKSKGIPHIWHLREIDYGLITYGNKKSYIKFISTSDHVICISQYIKNYFFREKSLGNVSVIYNGLFFKSQYNEMIAKFPFHRPDNPFTFLIAGVVQPTKGQITALKAFYEVCKNVPNIRLIIIGESSNQNLKTITDFIASHNLDCKVKITGSLPDILPELGKSNTALICSEYEAFGRVTIEAMACNCPVIVNYNSGLKEIVSHEVNGLFYDNDYHELAKQMLRMIQDQDLRNRLAESASEMVKEKYTIERYAMEVYNIYSSIIKNF